MIENFLKLSLLTLLLWAVPCASDAAQERPDAEFRMLLAKALQEPHDFDTRFDAEIWLVDMSARLAVLKPELSEEERFKVLKTVHREARRAKLDPQVVLALIEVESLYDKYAISVADARGLMQIMPFWKNEIGKETDNLFNIDTNIRYGCTILSLYLKLEKNDMTRALARYNGSRGKVWYPNRIYKALNRRWRL